MTRELEALGERAVEIVRRSAGSMGALIRAEHRGPIEVLTADAFEVRPSMRGPVFVGIAAILLGFGGFLIWGFTVNLDSAAVASGTVIVDFKKKTISHHDGGTLKKLLVAEGDTVTAGQPLLLLDDTRAAADLAAGEGQRIGLLARLARLRAEQSGASAITFPIELKQNTSAIAKAVMADETRVFSMRQDIYRGKIEVAEKQVEQFAAEAEAAAAQAAAYEDQKVLVAKQVDSIAELVKKGAATTRQQSDLETQYAQIVGNAGQYQRTRRAPSRRRRGQRWPLHRFAWSGRATSPTISRTLS